MGKKRKRRDMAAGGKRNKNYTGTEMYMTVTVKDTVIF